MAPIVAAAVMPAPTEAGPILFPAIVPVAEPVLRAYWVLDPLPQKAQGPKMPVVPALAVVVPMLFKAFRVGIDSVLRGLRVIAPIARSLSEVPLQLPE